MTKKLLVVEDDPQIRLLLKKTLRCFEEYNVELFFAEDGDKGMVIAKKEKPDLIFLDVMMPIMSGIEVCKEIKSDPELKNSQVIFLTIKEIEELKELGGTIVHDGHITKPFNPDYIVEKVSQVLHVEPC